jgi:hypothetical protein
VWDTEHPRPPGGPEFEKKLLSWITERDGALLAGCRDSREHFRQVYGAAFEVILGRNLATAGNVEFAERESVERRGYAEQAALVRNETYGEEVPILLLKPRRAATRAVIWADTAGKAGLFEMSDDGKVRLKAAVQKLLDNGIVVCGVDLLFLGEFLADGKPVKQSRRVQNPREAAAYTFGYNPTRFAERVCDLLSVIRTLRAQLGGLKRLELVGLNGAGPWVAAARAMAGDAVSCAAVDTGGFRFGNVANIYDVNLLPGAAKYGDLPGLLALGAPGKLWLAGEGAAAPELLKQIYQLSGSEEKITLAPSATAHPAEAAVQWLLEQK